jgi:hypothetical protein
LQGNSKNEKGAKTEKHIEEFCKKHGDRINMALFDPATAKWLVSEYGVSHLVLAAQSYANPGSGARL